MACWRAMVGLGLMLTLAGCGDEAGVPGSDEEGEASGGTTTMDGGARAVDLEGFVQTDAQGWLLELESAVEGGMQPAVPARRIRVGKLTASDAVVLDDALVDLVDPSALVATRAGAVPGTVLVGPSTTSSGILLVDLRPFGLDEVVPPAGTQLSRLRGVAEIGGSQPVILPRSFDDLIVAR